MIVRIKGPPPGPGEKRSVLYNRGCLLIPVGGLAAMLLGVLVFAAITGSCI